MLSRALFRISTLLLLSSLKLPAKSCIVTAFVTSAPLRAAPYSYSSVSHMPRGIKKQHLPEKTCTVCQRPFTWRKKWDRAWDEVQTCSKSCQAKRRHQLRYQNRLERLQEQQSDDESSSIDKEPSDESQLAEALNGPRAARQKLAKSVSKQQKRAKTKGPY